jgi:hypothetical protein
MRTDDLDSDIDRLCADEERAHALRMSMYRDRDFMAGLRQGIQDVERGDTVSLEEFERALDEP